MVAKHTFGVNPRWTARKPEIKESKVLNFCVRVQTGFSSLLTAMMGRRSGRRRGGNQLVLLNDAIYAGLFDTVYLKASPGAASLLNNIDGYDIFMQACAEKWSASTAAK